MLFLKQYKSKINALLLVALFIGYWSSITFFPHLHIVNGQIVVHSHPYSGTAENPGHSHGVEQLIVINLLTTLLAVAVIIKTLEKIYRGFTYFFTEISTQVYLNGKYYSYSLRGPPVC